ncbi:hypothetical protein B0H17DRAFT_1080077 [Mycena rosella]|uniref:MYND-type domain-containing protein n=1 Tax=Mycena rosella TaxID=1033263 RepID=A0AAD7D4K8_MYCRO|nr:hypothetical protein B0H17DRAFT_1080077 [Mycena rosella]
MNKCMHLMCTRPIAVKTAVCVKCGIVHYCSAQCQRPAWRAPELPHKPLCDVIHTLRAVLQLEDSAEWDSWVIRTKATDMQCSSNLHLIKKIADML